MITAQRRIFRSVRPAAYFCLTFILIQLLAACAPISPGPVQANEDEPTATPAGPATPTPAITPLPTRPPYPPGTLVDYTVQTGDTLDGLALHFNSSVDEIRTNNPNIPKEVTFLPPGMPMKIPIYYLPLWGSPFQIIPDQLFINGPAQVGFDTGQFIAGRPGWLKTYRGDEEGGLHSAGEIVDRVALDYSVSPRLLLALVDYASGGLTQPIPPPGAQDQPLGFHADNYAGLYLQLVWAANTLNGFYYDYRANKISTFDHTDGTMERTDPWQNAASVALQMFYANYLQGADYTRAIGPQGLAQTYENLFGPAFGAAPPHIPGNLGQPELRLPFQLNKYWAFTGGPHTGWGTLAPWAAIDFAPPSDQGGCLPSSEWVVASAPGVVARAETGLIILDLDGDGDERTGWTILYLHTEHDDTIYKGKKIQTGDILGHPSCERGHSTGTHVHLARKYNGEWMMAGGTVPFNLEGWVVQAGTDAYDGKMVKFSRTITACVCSDRASQLRTGE